MVSGDEVQGTCSFVITVNLRISRHDIRRREGNRQLSRLRASMYGRVRAFESAGSAPHSQGILQQETWSTLVI